MSDATIREDNATPTASDADIKRSDADANIGLGDATRQAIGLTPTDATNPANIENAPKTPS